MNAKTRKYNEALVIFIDILGTSDNDDFDSLFQINKLFRRLTNEQEQQDKKSWNQHRIYKRTIFSFSDCTYIVYDYKDGIDDSRKDNIELSWVALYNTVNMLQELIKAGYAFRGGVALGKVYYDKDENIVFGPAVVEAYKLESKCAKNPRVLIQEDTAIKILQWHNDNYNKLKSQEHIYQGISSINGEIIKIDSEDNKYHLNYLNNIDCDEEKLKEFILKQLEKAKNNNNIKVMKKYLWLSDYYKNEIVDKNNHTAQYILAAGIKIRDEFSPYNDIVEKYERNNIVVDITLNRSEYNFTNNNDKNHINIHINKKMD